MANTLRRKYSLLKWISGLIIFTVILAGTLSFYISFKSRPIVNRELKSLVLKATDSLYRIEFSDVETNIITGNASLSQVQIIPNTVILKKLIGLKRAPNNIYTIRLRKLMIQGFNPFTLFFRNKLNIDELLFDKPQITMVNKQLDFNEDKPPRPARSPYLYIAPYLKQLHVQSIIFRDISFDYVNNNTPKPEVDRIDNLNITLTDWLIDPTSANDRSRMYLLKDISLSLNDYTYSTPDSLYHVKVNQMDFHALTGKLSVKQFSIVPRHNEMDFGKAAGFEKDRYNISMNNISLTGINFPLYVLKQELFAKEMNISNGFIAVFNNNTFRKSTATKPRKDPHQLLQSLKGIVTLKKLNIDGINISYASYDNKSAQRGVISFEHTSGTLNNVTNSPKFKQKDSLLVADVNTYMMGQGQLKLNFQFNLLSKRGAFSYRGVLENMNGRSLNRITKPLGMLQIRSGYINKLSFNIKADQSLATGKVDFDYQGLNVGLFKKVEGKDNLVRQGWASFLANQLVIKPDNPDRKGKFFTATVNYEREPSATFFNFVWQTLFQGIKYSVGFTEAKKEEIANKIAQFEKIRSDREKRRLAREKRRLN